MTGFEEIEFFEETYKFYRTITSFNFPILDPKVSDSYEQGLHAKRKYIGGWSFSGFTHNYIKPLKKK